MTNRQAINNIYRLFKKYYNDNMFKTVYDLFLFRSSVEQLAKCGDLNDALIWLFFQHFGVNKQKLFKLCQEELHKKFDNGDINS